MVRRQEGGLDHAIPQTPEGDVDLTVPHRVISSLKHRPDLLKKHDFELVAIAAIQALDEERRAKVQYADKHLTAGLEGIIHLLQSLRNTEHEAEAEELLAQFNLFLNLPICTNKRYPAYYGRLCACADCFECPGCDQCEGPADYTLDEICDHHERADTSFGIAGRIEAVIPEEDYRTMRERWQIPEGLRIFRNSSIEGDGVPVTVIIENR